MALRFRVHHNTDVRLSPTNPVTIGQKKPEDLRGDNQLVGAREQVWRSKTGFLTALEELSAFDCELVRMETREKGWEH